VLLLVLPQCGKPPGVSALLLAVLEPSQRHCPVQVCDETLGALAFILE
jgi:hypothetical protein